MIKKILFSMSLVLLMSPVYGKYVFISSVPSGAKVSIITEKNKTKTIGTTPLKLTNFTKSTKIILEHIDYFAQTNTISKSTKVQSCNFILNPFSFDIQFPNPNQQPDIKVNGDHYSNLESSVALPFGNYEMSHKKGEYGVDYKNPYVPYVAFFSTVTVIATAAAIAGGVLASINYEKFLNSQTTDEFVDNMSKVSTWESVMWGGVSIGTGALIGTVVTASLDARDRRRIKRFNGMNIPSRTSTYFSEFQDIITISSIDEDRALKLMGEFIKKYPKGESSLLQDIYLRRASIYIQQRKYRQAISDLKKVFEDFPTRSTYELSSKILGDTYFVLKDYKDAYYYYTEALIVQESYSFEDIQSMRLESLYLLAKKSKSHRNIFLEETQTPNQIPTSIKTNISEWRNEFL